MLRTFGDFPAAFMTEFCKHIGTGFQLACVCLALLFSFRARTGDPTVPPKATNRDSAQKGREEVKLTMPMPGYLAPTTWTV